MCLREFLTIGTLIFRSILYMKLVSGISACSRYLPLHEFFPKDLDLFVHSARGTKSHSDGSEWAIGSVR